MKGIPTFKTEDSLWQMLADGSKTWDARKFDLSDARIRRLAQTVLRRESPTVTSITNEYVEKQVGFLNKASGQLAVFEYNGYHLLPDWAPGWCFLVLGPRVWPV